MLWEYRNDKWWELTIDLTRKALDCAYLTASLQEYVERCVEAAYLFPDEEKSRIMQNIHNVIKVTYYRAIKFPSSYLARIMTKILYRR